MSANGKQLFREYGFFFCPFCSGRLENPFTSMQCCDPYREIMQCDMSSSPIIQRARMFCQFWMLALNVKFPLFAIPGSLESPRNRTLLMTLPDCMSRTLSTVAANGTVSNAQRCGVPWCARSVLRKKGRHVTDLPTPCPKQSSRCERHQLES